MNDSDEIVNEIELLERRIQTLDRTFIKCTNDILEALKLQQDLLAEIGTVMALARSPSTEDLEKYGAMREAFDRYDFVRKLTVGKSTGEK